MNNAIFLSQSARESDPIKTIILESEVSEMVEQKKNAIAELIGIINELDMSSILLLASNANALKTKEYLDRSVAETIMAQSRGGTGKEIA